MECAQSFSFESKGRLRWLVYFGELFNRCGYTHYGYCGQNDYVRPYPASRQLLSSVLLSQGDGVGHELGEFFCQPAPSCPCASLLCGQNHVYMSRICRIYFCGTCACLTTLANVWIDAPLSLGAPEASALLMTERCRTAETTAMKNINRFKMFVRVFQMVLSAVYSIFYFSLVNTHSLIGKEKILLMMKSIILILQLWAHHCTSFRVSAFDCKEVAW